MFTDNFYLFVVDGCTVDCGEHGYCDVRVCACYEPYEGEDCSVCMCLTLMRKNLGLFIVIQITRPLRVEGLYTTV